MKYEISITVDTNDADYNTKVSEIYEEDLEKIKPLIEAIRKFQPYIGSSRSGFSHTHRHNYPRGDYGLRPDLGEKSPIEIYPEFPPEIHDLFSDFLPYCGDGGSHTIKSIFIQPAGQKTRLL